MAENMFRARVWGEVKIKPVTVERKTAKSVWVSSTWMGRKGEPRRRSRTSGFECYFDTWEEAKEYLVKKQQVKVDRLKKQTHEANSILGQLKAMKKPEEK